MEKPNENKRPRFNLIKRVEPVDGETLCYWVQSETRPGIRHRVDLTAYDGNGACGCERFEFACRGHLERGAKKAARFRCSHIRSAREFAFDELVEAILEEERRANEARKKVRSGSVDSPSGSVPDWGRPRETHSD